MIPSNGIHSINGRRDPRLPETAGKKIMTTLDRRRFLQTGSAGLAAGTLLAPGLTWAAEGDTLLEKIAYTVTFGLWTAYFLALEVGVDPVPVEGVESFKAKLKDVAGDI